MLLVASNTIMDAGRMKRSRAIGTDGNGVKRI
jgi:hypothetical protein